MSKLVECPKCLGIKDIFNGVEYVPCTKCLGKGIILDTDYNPEDDMDFIEEDNIIPFDDDEFYSEDLNGPLK